MSANNKEFEVLEMLSNGIRYKKEFIGNDTYRLYIKKNEIKSLEKYLTELKAIKEAKPSEAMEELDFMGNYKIPTANGSQHLKDFCNRHFAIIKQALLKAQEQEKVLEIICEKNVKMYAFKRDTYVLGKDFTYKLYLNSLGYYHSGFDVKTLTQEEFDLLKRRSEK